MDDEDNHLLELDEKQPNLPKRQNIENSQKAAHIVEACDTDDITTLQNLAQTAGGFLNDELRRKTCMLPPSAAIPIHVLIS